MVKTLIRLLLEDWKKNIIGKAMAFYIIAMALSLVWQGSPFVFVLVLVTANAAMGWTSGKRFFSSAYVYSKMPEGRIATRDKLLALYLLAIIEAFIFVLPSMGFIYFTLFFYGFPAARIFSIIILSTGQWIMAFSFALAFNEFSEGSEYLPGLVFALIWFLPGLVLPFLRRISPLYALWNVFKGQYSKDIIFVYILYMVTAMGLIGFGLWIGNVYRKQDGD